MPIQPDHRNYSALTLIELLVVIGIIIILSSLALLIIDPGKQRSRSQDAVLKNAIASIGQSIDSFYGLYGYYPDPEVSGQKDLLDPYIKDSFALTDEGSYYQLVNSNVPVGGVAGDPINYYAVGDIDGDGQTEPPCLEAVSNESDSEYLAWAPGYPVKVITSSCNNATGYGQLTGN